MTDNDGYNGWRNYETWAMNLWLTNEQGSSEWLTALATEEGPEPWEKAQTLKEAMEDLNPLGDSASVWADLMGAALSEIDWQEIIENHLEDND